MLKSIILEFNIMYFKYFLSLLLIFLFSISVYSAELKATKITNINNKINVEFNNTLQLKNFTLTDNNLVSPFYESKGNKYYFFSFLSRDFKNNIIKAANDKSNKIVDNTKGLIEYKINKCTIVKQPKTILAFMSVIFNDTVEINCNILNGKYGLWVAWPSIKEKDKWNKLFEIKDKNLKEEIETNLIKHYKQKRNDNKLQK